MSRCQVGDLLVLGAPLIGSHLAARPAGRTGRTLGHSASRHSTLDAIFCPSELDRPRTDQGDTGDGRWRLASPFIGDRQRVSPTVLVSVMLVCRVKTPYTHV